MEQQRFDALVSRLESYATRHPGLYKFRVACLAALGYAYIFFLLLAATAIVVGLAWHAVATGDVTGWHFAFGIPALIFAFLIARAVYAPLSKPEGAPLTRADAPALFDAVDSVRKTLRCPRIHQLLLTDDFNASLVQVPRLGLLGWQENFLTLGLPLLLALTPEQVTAVVAHELGHLSRNHSRFSGWVYRIEKTWAQVLASFNNRNRLGASVIRGFFRWYSPYFAAYSFVLRRANEFTADRASAAATTPALAAQALLTTEIRGKHLDLYWKQIFTTATHATASPPDDPFTPYATAAAEWPAPATITDDCRKAFRRKTASADSHPSLAARLTALGFPPPGYDAPLPVDILPAPARPSHRAEAPLTPDPQLALFPQVAGSAPADQTLSTQSSILGAQADDSAAHHFLNDYLPTARTRVSRLWRDHVLSGWVQRHNRVKLQLAELEKLDALSNTRKLTEEESWSRAHLTRECWGHERANPLAESHLNAYPKHAPANFTLGQSLLNDHDDAAGVERILAAMETDSEAILGGCQILVSYFTRNGHLDRADTYQTQHDNRVNLLNQARLERSLLRPGDRFDAHDWGLEKTQPIIDQLRQYKRIRRAWIVRKRVNHIPDIPCPILIIEPTRRDFRLHTQNPPHAKLRNQLATQLQLPEQVFIYVLDPSHFVFHALPPLSPFYEKRPRNPRY